MRNPWTKKNPLMSMWLSAANTAIGSARGHATAAVRREVASAQADVAQQVIDFWTGGGRPSRPGKKVRRR